MTNEQQLAAVHETGGDQGLNEVLSQYHDSLGVHEWAMISLDGMPSQDERLGSIVDEWFCAHPPTERWN